MIYTKFFSMHLQSQGAPHLTVSAFKVYMNIVHLEGQISSLEASKKIPANNIGAIEFKVSRLKEKLEGITFNKKPLELLGGLCSMSD
jgi:uncharacterized protein (DUF486 family)